ncbi:MAG: transglycosylase domain-containing protein [Myxococcota bacterium]
MLRRFPSLAVVVVLQFIFGLACVGRIPGCGSTPEAVERNNVMSEVTRQDVNLLYANDGGPLGALFEEEHRFYVPWEELPEAWIVAIVAAEDGRFWHHGGMDASHVARAARDNLGAGAVVAGGSTLTQQTAKNLFERQGRSLGAKFQELDYAFHLEDVFDKHEILEFYANLFHVTGNGEGLGVAARYFFNKTAKQLTVLECAYLAGIVKGPANYDPLRGDADARETALVRARERTRYVLGRIIEETPDNLMPTSGERIDETAVQALKAEAQRLLDDDPAIPFARGTFRFPRTVIVDEVAAQLEGSYFQDVLARAGIEDLMTSGLTVVTTIDLYQQHEAVYSLRHHLTETGLWLEPSEPSRFLRGEAPTFDPSDALVTHEFRMATIKGPIDGGIDLDLGGVPCRLDAEALTRAADALHRGNKGNRSVRAPSSVKAALKAALTPGSVVEVSVRDAKASRCDLELLPELQGAVAVLDQGRLRAMVGGSENRDFNRVLAKRQFGSTFKPLIYHAALTLGWQPDDALENAPQEFRFAGTKYSPRPDHTPAPEVSIAWAGVKSENIASVWLLAHLVEQLSADQIRALAGKLDLGPEPEETPQDYEKRLRKLGVNLDLTEVEDLGFAESKRALAERLRAEGRTAEAQAVSGLVDGEGRYGFQTLSQTAGRCRTAYDQLRRSLRSGVKNPPELWAKRQGNVVALACGVQPAGYRRPKVVLQPKRGKNGRRRPRLFGPQLVSRSAVQLPGGLTIGTVDALERSKPAKGENLETLPLTDPRRLKANPDFRWLLALRYVQELARRYGVSSKLPDVMSLPLGSVEISLQEAALLYSGLTSGQGAQARATGIDGQPLAAPPNPTLISEIRDAQGKVIFKAEPDPQRVATAEAGILTADILRNVVEHGTGRRARGLVSAGSAHIPIGGKTGTTNDFKNSAFVGFVPGTASRGFSAAQGSIVAAYVGFDDNRSMKQGSIRISGASGALPAWMGTVRGIVRFGDVSSPRSARAVDGTWPLEARGLSPKRVSASSGLPDRSGTAEVLVAPQRTVALPGAEAKPLTPVRPRSRTRRRWWKFW